MKIINKSSVNNFIRLFIVSIFCLNQSHAYIFDFFKTKELSTQDKIAQLRMQQIDYPEDPIINYNLGVALYKQDLFDQARVAFKRAGEHSDKKKYGVVKLQSLFNGANSCYQNCLHMLPVGWQTKDTIDVQTLSAAINHVSEAIDGYKKTLSINPLLYQANGNLQKAEELKKQLEEKLKQQPPQQNNQHQQEQKQSSSDGNSSGKKQTDNNSRGDDGNQNKNNGKDRPGNANEPEKQRQNNPNTDKKDKEAQEQQTNHNSQSDKKQDMQQPNQEAKQGEQENQESSEECSIQGGQRQKETAMAKAIFDNLKNDEIQSQKRFLQQQMNHNDPIQHAGQKPW